MQSCIFPKNLKKKRLIALAERKNETIYTQSGKAFLSLYFQFLLGTKGEKGWHPFVRS